MARWFMLESLLDEAHLMDLNDRRRQGREIRALELVRGHKDYVESYRLSEELIDNLIKDIEHLLKNPRRRGSGLSIKLKVST